MLPSKLLPMLFLVLEKWDSWHWLWNPQDHGNRQLLPAGRLHTLDLRCTQVTTATGAGSSHSPRWDSRWDLTSRLAKDDEILISCIRCHSQAGLTVVHIACIFLLSHQVMPLHHAAKFPSPTPYLNFNYKTNSFVFRFFDRKWHSVLRVSLMLRINQDSIYTLHYWEINKQIILNT